MAKTSTDVDGFLARYPPAVRDLAHQVRALLRSELPDANEIVYLSHSNIIFTLGRSMGEGIAYLAPFKGHVNLGLMYGASLPDPEKLLEGTGKNMRHIKVREAEQLQIPALRALIRAAAAQGKPSA
jgi:hypothetical protein